MKAPSIKLQHSGKHQAPNSKQKRARQSVYWGLVFGISLVLGAWILELCPA
jgi:uncharacterized membrane protein